MPDRTPTAAHLAFLADVRDRKVLTHEDMHVYLEIPGDPPALVSTMASLLEHYKWIREPADSIVWQLTERGHALLEWDAL